MEFTENSPVKHICHIGMCNHFLELLLCLKWKVAIQLFDPFEIGCTVQFLAYSQSNSLYLKFKFPVVITKSL